MSGTKFPISTDEIMIESFSKTKHIEIKDGLTSSGQQMDRRHSAATHFMLHRRRQFIHSLMKESYKISGRSRKKLDNERRRAIKEIVLDMVKRKFPNTTLTIDGVDKEFKKYDLKKKNGKVPVDWIPLSKDEQKEIEECYDTLNKHLSSLDIFKSDNPTNDVSDRQKIRAIEFKPKIGPFLDEVAAGGAGANSGSDGGSGSGERRMPLGTHFMLHKRRQFIHSLMKVSYKISAKSRSKNDNDRRRIIKETVLKLVRKNFPGTTLTIDGIDKEYKKYETRRTTLRNIPEEWLAVSEQEKKEMQKAIQIINEQLSNLPIENLSSPTNESPSRTSPVPLSDDDTDELKIEMGDIAPDPEYDDEHKALVETLRQLHEQGMLRSAQINYYRQLAQLMTLCGYQQPFTIQTNSFPLLIGGQLMSPIARDVSVIRQTSTITKSE